MLDVITKGYIATKLKIEALVQDQRGVIAIEYVALAIGITVIFALLFKDTSTGYGKALNDMFTNLATKIGKIGT